METSRLLACLAGDHARLRDVAAGACAMIDDVRRLLTIATQ
jgi:hypothetical protein